MEYGERGESPRYFIFIFLFTKKPMEDFDAMYFRFSYFDLLSPECLRHSL